MLTSEAREMTQWLKALAVLPEDPASVPSTQVRVLYFMVLICFTFGWCFTHSLPSHREKKVHSGNSGKDCVRE